MMEKNIVSSYSSNFPLSSQVLVVFILFIYCMAIFSKYYNQRYLNTYNDKNMTNFVKFRGDKKCICKHTHLYYKYN